MGRRSAWNDKYYVECYELAKQGCKNSQIAKILGVPIDTFKRWISERPALKDALKRARGGNEGTKTETFIEYVYNRLPEHIKSLWDELEQANKKGNSLQRIEALLKDKGKKTLQHLYVHALISSNFNASEACRRLNISMSRVKGWMADPDFAQLIDEVLEHKKNICESALMGLVMQGETSAVIFANRTLNRDRGYGDKTEHIHTHAGGVLHGHVDVDALPIELRRQLLNATREKEASNKLPGSNVVGSVDYDEVKEDE